MLNASREQVQKSLIERAVECFQTRAARHTQQPGASKGNQWRAGASRAARCVCVCLCVCGQSPAGPAEQADRPLHPVAAQVGQQLAHAHAAEAGGQNTGEQSRFSDTPGAPLPICAQLDNDCRLQGVSRSARRLAVQWKRALGRAASTLWTWRHCGAASRGFGSVSAAGESGTADAQSSPQHLPVHIKPLSSRRPRTASTQLGGHANSAGQR